MIHQANNKLQTAECFFRPFDSYKYSHSSFAQAINTVIQPRAFHKKNRSKMAFKKLIMVLLVSHMMVAFVSMRTADAFECYCECLSFCKRTMSWFNCTNECETHCLKLGKPRVPSDTEEYCATKTYPKHDEFLGGGGRPSTSHFKEDRSTVKA